MICTAVRMAARLLDWLSNCGVLTVTTTMLPNVSSSASAEKAPCHNNAVLNGKPIFRNHMNWVVRNTTIDFLKLFKLPKPQNCEWCLYEKEHEYLTSLEGVEAKPKEYFETCPRYFNLNNGFQYLFGRHRDGTLTRITDFESPGIET